MLNVIAWIMVLFPVIFGLVVGLIFYFGWISSSKEEKEIEIIIEIKEEDED